VLRSAATPLCIMLPVHNAKWRPVRNGGPTPFCYRGGFALFRMPGYRSWAGCFTASSTTRAGAAALGWSVLVETGFFLDLLHLRAKTAEAFWAVVALGVGVAEVGAGGVSGAEELGAGAVEAAEVRRTSAAREIWERGKKTQNARFSGTLMRSFESLYYGQGNVATRWNAQGKWVRMIDAEEHKSAARNQWARDAQLVAACRAGDKEAYVQLVERHYRSVFAFCLGQMGNAHDAEDAAQEVVLRGFRNIGKLRSDSAVRPWLLKIARNLCLDQLRRNGRVRQAIAAREVPEEAQVHQPEVLGEQLEQAIQRLPPEIRLPLVLYYFDGEDAAGVAEKLKISRTSVYRKLSQAARELHGLLTRPGGIP
jgi:RNA polymerase sigma-70 factor (ECF subfamily)